MQRIARFEHVSATRFAADWADTFPTAPTPALPALPRRATTGSAGYDFHIPAALTLAPGETVKIPTGIRAKMDDGWVLQIFPRSGLGFKYRVQLNNTVGIIDSDYYHSDNEGHILIKITNANTEGKTLTLAAGDAFAQGIFLPFGITEDDDAAEIRNGGFGSTSKR
ncbi:MAG: deoxyuridine 5'-triphosphate nucleotidohydrolase [Clostridia bacterium]|nr:deoxyuridine 5'-triphosphate nucleotidohydrolase [Clostridia bacterium]